MYCLHYIIGYMSLSNHLKYSPFRKGSTLVLEGEGFFLPLVKILRPDSYRGTSFKKGGITDQKYRFYGLFRPIDKLDSSML